MYCTNCGHQNPSGAKFCAQCGTALASPQDATTGMLPTAADEVREAGEDGLDADGIRQELSPGTALLVSVRGPNAGARFLLDKDVVTVGRHPDSDIFLDDITVSRRHAEFALSGEGVIVSDVGSLNGTYVNGTRAESKVLAHGDTVQVGKFRLRTIIPRVAAADGGGA